MTSSATIKASKCNSLPVVNKKESPDYGQISGFAPKDLIRRFKVVVASLEGVTISDAVEDAIRLWVKTKEQAKDEE